MNWFTADLHLNHGNIIKYCKRYSFLTEHDYQAIVIDKKDIRISQESIDRMNQFILMNLNNKVKEDDTLWILGDFAFYRNRKNPLPEAKEFREQINCKNVYLIVGNHDPEPIWSLFNKVWDMTTIEIDGQKLFMDHYPCFDWYTSEKGSWLLYGHVHSKHKEYDEVNQMKRLDVGVDTNNYQPYSFDDIKGILKDRINISG